MGSEEADANFASVICNNFQWATLLAAEQVMPPRAAPHRPAAHSQLRLLLTQCLRLQMEVRAALEHSWLCSRTRVGVGVTL